MKSIKELYRIGTGPSSSHTMGPRKAAQIFLERHPEAAAFQVTLYGTRSTGRNNLGAQNIPALPSQRYEIRLFGQRRQGDRPMDRIQRRRRCPGRRE